MTPFGGDGVISSSIIAGCGYIMQPIICCGYVMKAAQR